MPSSTSPRAPSDRRLIAVLFAVIVGAPLLWLTLLEANYVLAYQACADGTNAWLHGPDFAALALGAGAVAAAVRAHAWSRDRPLPRGFLGAVAAGLSALILIVLIASAIAPFILHPCD
jgi:hypothetical protein